MDFFENFFGNLSSGIIRLIVAVGILAAVSIFIVKPILSTTNHAVDSADESVENAFKESAAMQKSIEAEVDGTVRDTDKQVQRRVERSTRSARTDGDSEKLLHCIQRAHQNIHRIERCTQRY
jgi:F0F1-type ATP synthase membrane subunit b/b'